MTFRLLLSRFNDYSRNGVIAGLSGILLSGPVFGFMLWKSYAKQLAMIDHAKTVPAELLEVGTGDPDPRTGDPGGATGTYRYTMLGGNEGTISLSRDTLDEIPGYDNDAIVDVEYLPENPKVNRIKGEGNQNMSDLKFWTGFKGVLLSLFFNLCNLRFGNVQSSFISFVLN